MSFLDIKDPKKRDAIVAEYLATKNRIQHRNMNEKAQDLAHSEELKEIFHPVTQSTEKSADVISKELAPLKEEMRTLNANLQAAVDKDDVIGPKKKKEKKNQHRRKGVGSSRRSQWTRDTGMNALNFYLNHFNKLKLDKYFGIQITTEPGGELMMGNRAVGVDNDSNIHIDDKVYNGTSGLWALIMLASPSRAMYTDEDVHMYRDLAKRTNVAHNPRGTERHLSRPKSTYKWKTFFAARTADSNPSSDAATTDDRDDDDGDSDADDERGGVERIHRDSLSSDHAGSGVVFLPGDIKGLKTKLKLLLAEFRAGNTTATRNEIIPILDELLRRRQISRIEYNDINRHISV